MRAPITRCRTSSWLTRLVAVSAILLILGAASISIGVPRASAAPIHSDHADWTYWNNESAYWFVAYECEDVSCIPFLFYIDGNLGWNVGWSGNWAEVTQMFIASAVPEANNSPFAMDVYTNVYIYDGNRNYVGEQDPGNPNAHHCAFDTSEAVSCGNVYPYWWIYAGNQGALFEHSSLVNTNDDLGDIYQRWVDYTW